MADINKLFGALSKCQEQILSAVDSLNQVSKESIAFGGDIARVVPQNLKVAMDQLLQTVQGSGQSSLESVIQYLDNVPVSALRKQSLVKTTINDEGVDQTSTAAEAQATINTQPNTSAGAQSAVARESFNLSDFYKDEYKSAPQRIKEADALSFDSILDNPEMGIDHGDIIDDDPLSFDAIPSNYEDDYVDDEMMFDDGAEPEEFGGSWRDIHLDNHPEDRDLGDIFRDTREPVELGV